MKILDIDLSALAQGPGIFQDEEEIVVTVLRMESFGLARVRIIAPSHTYLVYGYIDWFYLARSELSGWVNSLPHKHFLSVKRFLIESGISKKDSYYKNYDFYPSGHPGWGCIELHCPISFLQPLLGYIHDLFSVFHGVLFSEKSVEEPIANATLYPDAGIWSVALCGNAIELKAEHEKSRAACEELIREPRPLHYGYYLGLTLTMVMDVEVINYFSSEKVRHGKMVALNWELISAVKCYRAYLLRQLGVPFFYYNHADRIMRALERDEEKLALAKSMNAPHPVTGEVINYYDCLTGYVADMKGRYPVIMRKLDIPSGCIG